MANKRAGLNDREVKKSRPINALFGTVPVTTSEIKTDEQTDKKPVKKEKKLIRQTYHMNPVIVEAVKILDFETREGISSIINRILEQNIDDVTLEQAKKNIMKRKGV